MFERPRSGEAAILVHLDLQSEGQREQLQEFEELARSAGARIVGTVTGSRHTPEPKYFVGSGKVEEIRQAAAASGARLVLFNNALTPSQERNLERALECRVLDRTGLILDIFAQRARSFEGKLQVELAQLRHLSTRLVRGWTHLERQKGGIGLRGPGETQLETDRRLLGNRIRQLKKRLHKVHEQRNLGRRARRKAETPTVSLVGYTNAGKSTLFNRLTDAGVLAADQLFATLDPTLRRITLPGGDPLVLADTVGFIRHLPHDLVEAFQSTLEETAQAGLLLHVIDAGDEERDAYMEQVQAVLQEIGADQVPQIQVYNKIDLAGMAPRIDRDGDGRIVRVWVSAATGAGMDLLLQALSEYFSAETVHGWLRLPVTSGRLRAQLYQHGDVLTEEINDSGEWLLEVQLPRRDLDRLMSGGRTGVQFRPVHEECLATGVQGP
ncbi:MAG: GTPase HflX [Gammaproteobacteria bacterium]